ncbi:MAG: peptidylprolyl isomerase [Candidatus Hydrogenedentes bacterium]|nr:peptidylprolyl isomerase [Candidatus Hydrogenedentota bacterium]
MNRRNTLLVAFVLAIACVVILNLIGVPSRITDEDQQRRDKIGLRLEKIHAEENITTEKSKVESPKVIADSPKKTEETKEKTMWPETAPDTFKVKFECTNGEFIVECTKEWAPIGVERFYALVREGYFDNTGFFRVVPGFVVQFGLAADPKVTAKWKSKVIKDDPVTQTNAPGTLTFATSGPNSRTTQLFINLGNNARLDGMGFAAFGKIVEGMPIVQKISSKYGERPQQNLITNEGDSYLRKNFPDMDYITKATLIK